GHTTPLLSPPRRSADRRPDVLGGDWVARDLDLPDGAVATLVRRETEPAGDRPAVLYVHGFIDYFFQTHVAEAVEARGYRFYALEDRKSTRLNSSHVKIS